MAYNILDCDLYFMNTTRLILILDRVISMIHHIITNRTYNYFNFVSIYCNQ